VARRQALIVEDNKEIGQIYSMTLDMIDYDTHHVIDGKIALNYLNTGVTPDLIILDMNLPQVSGHYVYKTIRADRRFDGTVVIIATANTVVARALANDLAPTDQILVKPVSARQLRDIASEL